MFGASDATPELCIWDLKTFTCEPKLDLWEYSYHFPPTKLKALIGSELEDSMLDRIYCSAQAEID